MNNEQVLLSPELENHLVSIPKQTKDFKTLYLDPYKPNTFKKTKNVEFSDITIEGSNATDLVVHSGFAISPPNTYNDDDISDIDNLLTEKPVPQFYIHHHQTDFNRVISGRRVFEVINPSWIYPYFKVTLSSQYPTEYSYTTLRIPPGTYHRSVSYSGSVVINQAIRDEEFDHSKEFTPVSVNQSDILRHIYFNYKPIVVI